MLSDCLTRMNDVLCVCVCVCVCVVGMRETIMMFSAEQCCTAETGLRREKHTYNRKEAKFVLTFSFGPMRSLFGLVSLQIVPCVQDHL
jgi:hypothetical protein